MGRVLVTGGRGFLGSHLVARLAREGHQVRIFARPHTEPGRRAPDGTLVPGANGHETVWGDIRDPAAVDRAVRGVETVIHLVSNFRRSGSDRTEAHAINVGGTEHVLQAALRHGVRRLLHCSTVGVHGDVRAIPADEETPVNPGDRYQETKLIAEQRVRECARGSRLAATVIRPIPMFGPGDRRMLKLFRAIDRGWFVMVGSGKPLFQLAYVDDVVEGFLLCLRTERSVGEVVIVGGEEYVPLNDLVRMIAEALGARRPRLRVPLAPVAWLTRPCEAVCAPLGIDPPLHRRRLSFFENNRAFRIDKAKRILGYRPQVSLRDGIERTIAWYRTHGWL